jgi:SSS family solute:Na+ symporter
VKGFGTLDYIVVITYLAAIAVLGSSFYRRGTTSKEYFLGGRSMSWVPVGISIIAADLSAVTVMGTPAWAFDHNLELFIMGFGYPLMAPLIIYVFVPSTAASTSTRLTNTWRRGSTCMCGGSRASCF